MCPSYIFSSLFMSFYHFIFLCLGLSWFLHFWIFSLFKTISFFITISLFLQSLISGVTTGLTHHAHTHTHTHGTGTVLLARCVLPPSVLPPLFLGSSNKCPLSHKIQPFKDTSPAHMHATHNKAVN